MSLNWVDKIDNVDDIRAEDFNNLVASIEQNKVDKIAGMGLSTNDYTKEDKSRVENSLQFKGEVEETALPTENSVKGDVYKLLKPIAKSYIASSIRYDENVGCYNFFANQYAGLYTEEEYNYMMDNPNGGYFGPEVSCDVYDCDWKYICTKPMSYADDCGYWCMGDKGELIEGVNYNVVRSDDAVVMDSELNTHEFLVDAGSYAIYNGESFDKFYNEETVDKIADEIYTEIEDAKQWKTLIDTTLTEEQAGVSSVYIEIPNWELLKTASRMRLFVNFQAGEEAIASQTLQIIIRNNGGGMYLMPLCWDSNISCGANGALYYRGVTEFFSKSITRTTARDYICFYTAPSKYDGANGVGNARKIFSSVDTTKFNTHPPYLHLNFSGGGIMTAGTRIYMEVYE